MELSHILLLAGALVASALGARIFVLGLEDHDVWSISVYHGTDPLRLGPHPTYRARPALEAADIRDVSASFVADPFLVRSAGQWLMFFEVFNASARRGEIAVASSPDGVAWTYDRTVLREPFHLSYPYVFQSDGTYYMIPETGQAGEARLYRCSAFPYEWRFERVILAGKHLDPSVVKFDGRWWLFSQRNGQDLVLHVAEHIEGPWIEHRCSPVVRGSISTTRPGGRLLQTGGRLIRFAQDGDVTYGRRLRAFEIEELTMETYRERELPESPILDASGCGWNADGMHHLDALEMTDGAWIAAVDGKRIGKHFNWRRGVRRIAGFRV
jgi:hypothetical protein